MLSVIHDPVEARTRELGADLLERARAYRPPIAERLQDHLLVALSRDCELQRRLLGFVDVLSGLSFDRSGRRTRQLAREYLRGGFGRSPWWLRAGLWLGTLPALPSPVVARAAGLGAGFVASRFIVSPDARALEAVLGGLSGRGRDASLDLLGEQVLSEAEADAYAERYLSVLDRLRPARVAPAGSPGRWPLELSLKLSSLTGDFNANDPDGTMARVRPRLERVASAARAGGVALTVDAEQYEYRDLGWHIFRSVFGSPQWRDWDGAGLVVQAYLRDAPSHAREVLALARGRAPFRVRLVKGAYWDYEVILAAQLDWPCPVYRQKDGTDACFEAVARELVAALPAIRLAVASHNIRSHAAVQALGEAAGAAPGLIEHQTLYRTAEGISRALASMGWPSRDYVPVGELLPAMAYLARRILENSSQSGFLLLSRLGETADVLLRRPEAGEEHPEDVRGRADFINHPPPRLFLAAERERFRAALAEVRGQPSGVELRLELGGPAGSMTPSLDPADGSVVASVEFANAEHAAEAIRRANAASGAWVDTPVRERAEALRRAAEILAMERDTLAAWVVCESGKAVAEAYADVDEAIDFLRYYALGAEHTPMAGFAPRGVVAVIPPWNFPIAIPCGMIAAALVTGNAVILKPAEETPAIARLLVDAMHRAGVPRDALTWLPGEGESIGRLLVESPDVDMVAFTGSRAVGDRIFRTCAATITARGAPKAVVAETGGKNPLIICADADVDDAIRGVLRSAFAQANQKCSAVSRVLVERPIWDTFVQRLREAAGCLVVGPGAEFGTFIPPVISASARERIIAAATNARREGAVILDALERPDVALGPLIVAIAPVRAGTAVTAQEEIFGPILALIPFDTLEDAVRIANGVAYGLTSGVYSRSRRAIQELICGIDAGHVYVNRDTVGARVGIEPFGGHKLSGTGPKAGSEEYLWAFVRRAADGRPDEKLPAPGSGAPPELPVPWRASPRRRAAVLAAAAAVLDRPLAAGVDLALRVEEIAEPQRVREIPGQRSYVDWRTPRGAGIAAFEGATDETAGAFVAAALLAGNGLTVVGSAGLARLVAALHDAGVPAVSLRYEADAANLLVLAEAPYSFAMGSLPLRQEVAMRAALAANRPGLPAFRQWIGDGDGPPPGVHGFVRRFAVPKAMAINTLRHAVDLGL